MQFKQYQTNVFKVLSNDSDLLKILFHLPKHNNDNPLDKEDILSMPSSQKLEYYQRPYQIHPIG